MSDLAKRIDVHANAGLLLQQWQQAPRMRALVDALQGVVDDHLVKPLEEMEERLRIDVAEGVWLDFIGERLMLPRPATMTTDYAFFGFQGSGGVGFDQGPLATVVEALSFRVPVGDVFYRRLLRMRAEVLLTDGSVPALEAVASKVFPRAEYVDHGDMSVTVRNPFRDRADWNLLDTLNAVGGWPSPSGVSLSSHWEYIVGGDCEGDDPPAVYGHSSSHLGLTYERSDEQAHSGIYSWKSAIDPNGEDFSVYPVSNLPYADLVPGAALTFSAWAYVDSGTSDDLYLSNIFLDIACGQQGDEGNVTWDHTQSDNPTAFDEWQYLEAARFMPSTACDQVRLAFSINDQSAAHVVYWDDISFRSEP